MRSALDTKTLNWLANGETGISSSTMAFWLAFGILPDDNAHPRDVGDFNRCLLLLKEVPELRQRLPEMAKLSPHWDTLVTHWDELEALFVGEAGLGWRKANSAPKAYARMRELFSALPEA